MDAALREEAIAVIIEEAAALDHRQWDEWLDLYTEDAIYWMPAWVDEHSTTTDPKREISMIYYGDRSGIEDRIFRIRTGLSLASTPLPRTCHMNTNFRVAENTEGEIVIHSSWVTHSYKLKKMQTAFGVQEHRLRKTNAGLKICFRKITLHNDTVDTMLDVYNL